MPFVRKDQGFTEFNFLETTNLHRIMPVYKNYTYKWK